ncbi:VOC family protein [Bdellovibrio reynosensis]|uniref:VOC family protein n=1 Tax=Bdellovibrio reynosensis TaxID=2835041 RepID=A0ABY4CBW4_9BACT|nr:VOC family protein [Bdellovibrio reynosensis]UOF02468.1 VOC family protein [Bdellovibrio reynosensis]
MQKISPCLWFNTQAEEAAKFYTSVFKNSKILRTSYYGRSAAEVSGMPQGSVLTVEFEIEGQYFTALNGGPIFQFTPAISLMVNCQSQAEVDELFKKMSADPKAEQCGWLKDKFGISWQIVPEQLNKMMEDKDPEKVERVMQAMLKMKKLDIAGLESAYRG